MNKTDQNIITITPDDLPLICTGPEHQTWNGHPRIFLPIRSNNNIACPYCGSQYHLNGLADQYH